MKIKKAVDIIIWALFIGSFLLLCYYLRTRIWTVIDSDMSSEMVLARLLRDEHRIMSPNWYYSTELRVLYVTQVFALLFNFTDNWYMVRVYGEIIMHILLLVSLWLMMTSFGKKRLFPLTGLFLCLPFSIVYAEYELYTTAYIPYVITAFLGIALTVWFVKTADRRICIITVIAAAVNAFVSSLIGFRPVVMFYLPAFLGALLIICMDFFRSHKKIKESGYLRYLMLSTVSLVSSLAGCAVNTLILLKRYKVFEWNDRRFVAFTLGSVIRSISGMINNLGYRASKISLPVMIANGYAILIFGACIGIVWWSLKNYSKITGELVYLSAFFVCSAVVFILLYSLTDMVYYDLYSLPVIVFVFPIVAAGIHESGIKPFNMYSMYAVLIALVWMTSLQTYSELRHTDENVQRREIVEYLAENDYHNGYATFWNANVLTELSNGTIEMYGWQEARTLSYVTGVDDTQQWLQKTSHDTEKPQGKVFQLFDRAEIRDCNWKDYLLDDDIVYETGKYIVYGYGSYDEMTDHMDGYEYEEQETDDQ